MLGGGTSGIAAARLALAGGALVWIFDTADAASFSEVLPELEAAGIEMRCGEEAMKVPDNLDLVVISPGIDRATPLAQSFLASGAPMIGEIEFAFQRDSCRVAAITGTNGKTTTTELVAHLLNGSGRRSVAAGNYGRAYSDVVMESGDWDAVALEVSSFQLEEIDTFRPEVSVWMNFAPDHMDRYRTVEDYRQAKLRIFENQTEENVAVVNAQDPPQGIQAKKVTFSAFGAEADFTCREGKIHYHGEEVADYSATGLHGLHNAENVMAAMGAVHALGVPFSSMQEALNDYNPPPHRCEKVAEIDGVTYINDSKATNLHALESSLRGQENSVVLIAGGKNKGLDYGDISEVVADKATYVVAIGEMADAIERSWKGSVPCGKAESLDRAVELAGESAEAGQAVLFSPGTSSFDMFSGYVERGDTFKNIVRKIANQTQAGEQV